MSFAFVEKRKGSESRKRKKSENLEPTKGEEKFKKQGPGEITYNVSSYTLLVRVTGLLTNL